MAATVPKAISTLALGKIKTFDPYLYEVLKQHEDTMNEMLKAITELLGKK